MLAKSVIIICSGKYGQAPIGELDRLIRKVLSLKKNPILVLGPDGDEIIRSCEEFERCEMVFDPNFDGELFSSVKAGLHATNGASFVVPLTAPVLDETKWALLEQASFQPESESEHVIRPVTHEAEAPVYPQLVTAQGVRALKNLSSATDWAQSERIATKKLLVQS